VLAAVGDHVWALGDETWPAAIGRRLDALGWDVGMVEVATGGTLLALLGDAPWLRHAESLAPDAPAVRAVSGRGGSATDGASPDPAADSGPDADDDASAGPGSVARALALRLAREVRERAGTAVGLAVIATPRGQDTTVAVAVATPAGAHSVRRLAFLGGAQGRSRAALTAAAVLLERLDASDQVRTA
jgi:nicotinamide mononucleotide (NMN) deamidase PncC